MSDPVHVLRLDRDRRTAAANLAVKSLLVVAFVIALGFEPSTVEGKAMGFRAPLFLAPAVVVPVLARWRRWDPYPHAADALLSAPFLVDTLGNLLGFYDRYPATDDVLHGVNWVLLVGAFHAFRFRAVHDRRDAVLLGYGVGAIAIVWWELMEWLVSEDGIGGAGGLALTYEDTVLDLFLSSIGGLIGSVLGVRYLGPTAPPATKEATSNRDSRLPSRQSCVQIRALRGNGAPALHSGGRSMSDSGDSWDLSHLRAHIQAAVDLEFWTIPFYISSMYSIKDRNSAPYQLMRSVVNQEMLHLQCAANIANAYGFSPSISAPVYEGQTIPHLDFFKDDADEVDKFEPYTATIGPLDLHHINAMCLVELPEYLADDPVELNQDVTEYGTIGEFYRALRFGAAQHVDDLHGGVNQVDAFSAFYRNAPALTITASRGAGFDEAELLMDLITDQGEGDDKKEPVVLHPYQNTADDPAPGLDHFAKFLSIKDHPLPDTFETDDPSDYTEEQRILESILIDSFTELRHALEALFCGQNPTGFFPVMAGVGGAIRNCWEHRVTPRYS